ncbi:hypothetical protein WSM22_13940 [Cytophagales bacterium WSM2-2]|nr:hypothetical protein WSM22_13940 [Cytophagales bacterium WSM2-2]
MKGLITLLLSCLAYISLYATQYKTFEENGKVGLKDDQGNVVIPPAFEALGWSDGSFSVIGEVTGYRIKGLWGLINLKKIYLTKAEFENLVYSGGESVVARKKINAAHYKTGCLNLRGEIKIPFGYDGIQVQGLRAIVFNLTRTGFHYGLADLNNKLILPVNYRYIRPLGTLRYAVENSKGKIALYNEEGNAVTDFVIDSVSVFYKGYAKIYQDHLLGLIDRDGVAKLETKFQDIKIEEDGTVLARLPSIWSFLTEKNENIKEVYADEIKPLSEKLFYIKRGGRWGLIDDELKLIITPRYEHLAEVETGKFLARLQNRYGVIDKEKAIIPFSFDSLTYYPNKKVFSAFTKSHGWQLVNEHGRVLTDHSYAQMHLLPNQDFSVQSKGFYGMVNSHGKEFIHCVFDSMSSPVNERIAVKFKSKYGIINANEDWLVAPQDFPLQAVNEKVYVQRQPENQFVKTFAGEIKYFTPYTLKFEKDFFTETLPDGTEKKISYDGLIFERTPLPENTEEVFPVNEGLRGFKKDGRYGFIDTLGRLRIANRYDSIGEFHEGLAAVKLIGKWGFVNTEDQIVVNPNYDREANFFSGKAIVSRNGRYGIIDKSGGVVLPLRYDRVLRQPNSFLIISSNQKGLAGSNGNVTVEPRFDTLTETVNNLLMVCRDGKCGVITDHGLNVIPMIYDQLIFCKTANIFLAGKKSERREVEIK